RISFLGSARHTKGRSRSARNGLPKVSLASSKSVGCLFWEAIPIRSRHSSQNRNPRCQNSCEPPPPVSVACATHGVSTFFLSARPGFQVEAQLLSVLSR